MKPVLFLVRLTHAAAMGSARTDNRWFHMSGQLTSEGVPGKLTIEGKSGRTLFLNATWENPSGSWRVGAKRLFDILPGGLQVRCVITHAILARP